MLIIDNREIKLIELLKIGQIQYVTENLLIGDIIIKHTVSSTPGNEITYTLLCERKTLTDMIASIKDGRYKEQKIRLQAELANNISSQNKLKILYILEGLQNELRLPQDKTIINGVIISSIFRDGIPIIQTANLQETFNMITRLQERITKNPIEIFTNSDHNITTSNNIISTNAISDSISNVNTSSSAIENVPSTIINSSIDNNVYINSLQNIKKCKKDNITPQNWNIMCYMNIPGISNNIALKIAEKYPTIKSLVNAYEQCNNDIERENLITNIILTETDKQKRKIGPVISKKVFNYFNS
jgi:crossover junction endonuclease MUS81